MGTTIATDISGESFLGAFDSPVRRGLQAIHFTNETLDKCKVNFAPGKRDISGAIFGTPTVFPGYLRCTGLKHFLQTGVRETRDGTLLVIFRNAVDDAAVANRTMPAGTYRGVGLLPGASGIGLYAGGQVSRVNGLAVHAPNDGATATLLAATVQAIPLTNWQCIVQTFSDAVHTCQNMTAPYSAQQTPASVRRVTQDQIRIGSPYTSYTGVCDVASFQYHDVVLDPSEIELIYAAHKAYVSGKGVSA